MDTNLRGDDPDRVGHSLANLTEVLFPLLDAAGASSVVEIGSYAGDLTGELLNWAAASDARVIAIDPEPQPQLVELSERHPDLELVRETSHAALRHIPPPGAVIVDGDHNYYTVSGELRAVDELSSGPIPLMILHDVCWPHGRRDAYYDPERIPPEHRTSLARDARLFPGEPGLVPAGLPYRWSADHEGGPRNGVLTAIEDFVEARDGVRLAIVPAFFGIAVLWPEDAPWAGAVARILEPLDRNPILARLEANRVYHIAKEHAQVAQLIVMEQHAEIKNDALRQMLDSTTLAWGERLSRVLNRGRPELSREVVRRALDATPR
jgi:Methyltransferase domain